MSIKENQMTFKAKAWLRNEENFINDLDSLFFSNCAMESIGYIFVGEATIVIDCFDQNTLIQQRVKQLEEKIITIQAVAETKITELKGEINSLLALENGAP